MLPAASSEAEASEAGDVERRTLSTLDPSKLAVEGSECFVLVNNSLFVLN